MALFEKRLSGFNDVALLIGRILIAVLFLIAAYNKAKGMPGTATYFGRLGVPAPAILIWVVIAFEVIVGLFVLAGFQTRFVALAMAVFCVIAGLLAHTNFADASQLNHFLKNLAIAGGCLALFVSGAGAYSVDARRRSRWW